MKLPHVNTVKCSTGQWDNRSIHQYLVIVKYVSIANRIFIVKFDNSSPNRDTIVNTCILQPFQRRIRRKACFILWIDYENVISAEGVTMSVSCFVLMYAILQFSHLDNYSNAKKDAISRRYQHNTRNPQIAIPSQCILLIEWWKGGGGTMICFIRIIQLFGLLLYGRYSVYFHYPLHS